MKLEEINRIALLKGINPCGRPKWEVVRLIQIAEGNKPCYGINHFECKHVDCFWRSDCLGKVRIIEVM